jgi:condensin-2 complex subunit D3
VLSFHQSSWHSPALTIPRTMMSEPLDHDEVETALQQTMSCSVATLEDQLEFFRILEQHLHEPTLRSASARSILSQLANGAQWEHFRSVLLQGMEERLSKTVPLLTLEEEDDNGLSSATQAITFAAATVYAQLLQRPGALAVGLVSMDALSALQNVLLLWRRQECGGREGIALSTKQIVRRKGNTDDEMEEVEELEGFRVKRNRRTVSFDAEDSPTDDDDDLITPLADATKRSPAELRHCALRLASEVCQIPLRQIEMATSWKIEAVEVVVGCITTCMTVVQALSSAKDATRDERSMSHIVDSSMEALTCIISPSEKQNACGNRDDDNGFDSSSFLGVSVLSRRHDIMVVILRSLYPVLVRKDLLPNGTAGTIAAAELSSDTLERIIHAVSREVNQRPKTWSVGSNSHYLQSNSSAPLTPPRSINKNELPSTLDRSPLPLQRHGSMTPKLKVRATRMSTPHANNGMLFRPGQVMSALLGLLQQLATAPGLELAALRKSVIDTIHRCVRHIPSAERTYFLQFLLKLGCSKVPMHRLVAAESIGSILIHDEWIWAWPGMLPESLWSPGTATMTPYTASKSRLSLGKPFDGENALGGNSSSPAAMLLAAVAGRIVDRSPTIRATSVTVLSNVCQQMITMDHETILAAFQSVIAYHANEWIERLRVRVLSDEKATVRRASCTALVDLLMVVVHSEGKSAVISESDIYALRLACQDASILTRRAAAEAITSLLECMMQRTEFPSPPNTTLTQLENAWAISVLPMVLDTEPTCVNKISDLFDRLILQSILSPVDLDAPSKATAFRILAKLGNETKPGRNDADALRTAIQKCVTLPTGKSNPPFQAYVSIFRMINTTVIYSLDDCANNLFDALVDEQRTGIWCLFDAVLGNGALSGTMIRAIKQSKMDVVFLATAWDKLLALYMSPDTPSKNKLSLQKCLCNCLHVLSHLATMVESTVAQKTATKLHELIANFSLSPEVISPAVAALAAATLAAYQSETQRNQYEKLAERVRSLYQKCEWQLATLGTDSDGISRCGRALFTVGELSIIGFTTSDDTNIKIPGDCSKQATDGETGNSNVLARDFCERPSKHLIELVQAFMTHSLPTAEAQPIPVSIRAHAFVVLGKLCLRSPDLAKKSLNILARELHESIDNGDWILQSNALLVLGDLCVKYTNMVDRFLPLMAGCLQAGAFDSSDTDILKSSPSNGAPLVRKHAILLLSSLLLQDYIKWRGLLFHRFLFAAVDQNFEVAEMAEMALLGPLLSKQPRLFANHFVESLFVLNRCTDHPIFRAAAAMGDGGSGISVGFEDILLEGDEGQQRRLQMYELMLTKMSDEEKISITARIGKEVLGGALKSGSELNVVVSKYINSSATTTVNKAAFNVLSDALTVLQCPQIRVGKSSRNTDEDIEDPNISTNNAKRALVAKGRLLSNVSRKHLIEILMPILCQLKSVLETSRSPLLKDLMTYLLDVFHRYKTEVKEFLASDPTTLREIEYDAHQWKLQHKRVTMTAQTDDDDFE